MKRWFINGLLTLALASLTACKGDSNHGCETDKDCKGDRLCQRGECVDPTKGELKPPNLDPNGTDAKAQSSSGNEAPGAVPQSRVAQCNALVTVLNSGAQDIDKGTKAIAANPTSASEYKSLAEAADQVADKASKINIMLPELRKLSTQYQITMKKFSRSARDTGAAVEAKDADRMTAEANEMEKVGKEEEELISKINKFCQSP